MILGIIQARVSSSRLPKKVCKTILGKPMLSLQIERIKRATQIDKIILATSDHSSDNTLTHIAKESDVEIYRGSLDDVLTRFYYAALPHQPKHVIRMTGDCPVIDPGLIDQLVHFYLNGGYDYARLDDSFPDGLDVEIISWDVLTDAYQKATLSSEREHVTLYINKQPNLYKIGKLTGNVNYGDLRWTVDEKKDFELVTKIYKKLYNHNPNFSWIDILEFLKENPALMKYNIEHKRNEGLQKSLLADKIF